MKNQIKFFRLIILNLALLVGISHAESVTKVATTSASFLEIGAGPRAIAMGGAFVAIANDASALYWNPGGISRVARNEFVFVHTQWLADVSYNFLGIVIPLAGIGTVGASYTALSMDDMLVTTIADPEGNAGLKFSPSDLCIGLSFARNLTDRFSIGFNAKYVSQNIMNMSASQIAFDLGTLFTTQFRGMKIGMSMSNYGGKMQLSGRDVFTYYDTDVDNQGNNDRIYSNLQTEKYPLPLIFRVGLSMDVLKNDLQRLTMAVDALHPNNNSESMNVGMEYGIWEKLFLRAGYQSLFMKDSEEGLSAGFGVLYPIMNNQVGLKIDYAYSQFGILTNVHRFSMSVQF